MANSSTKDTISARSKIDKSHLMKLNDAEGITKLLHEYGCRVLCLKMVTNKLDDHSSPVKPNSITYDISENGKASSGEINYGQEAVTEWVETTKSDLSNQQQDLICIAWTSKDMIKLAIAFPQTLAIDATHKTVKIDGLLLLTVTVKDSFGKTTVVLRLWIPNQKSWIFKYVLLVVIPKIFGQSICFRVKAFITDGDPQFISMIDLAIKKLYVNAVRLACGWHLIDRPMAKQRKKFITQKVVSPYFVEWFCRFLQRWLFTWMRPSGGIYSKEEFEVSKAILMSFLESDALKQKFTKDGVAAIKEYVLNVLKYEPKFLSTEFMDVFALEVYSNSAHEGTNKGAKYNKTGGGLSPTSSLGTSTDQLADYDEQVSTERFKTCCDDFKKRKNWTPQWDELTSKSASILMDQESKTKLVNKIWLGGR